MTKPDFENYYERWKALDDLIDATSTYYDALGPKLPRGDVIVHLLNCLRLFASGQFQFFFYGFQSDPANRLPSDPILRTWDDFPPEDILTAIIDQMSHDLALIQRAADQRLANVAAMTNALRRADCLARRALQPAVDGQVIDPPTTVLTYFEKTAEFYYIPYSKVALISIPFTCTSVDKDFLAIPHEAGHYVYRNLRPAAKDDLKQLRLLPKVQPPYQDWARAVFEEMCADIYGCLVGGPVMALDFQELCQANAQANFTGSDGQHPNPALRPLIYSQVMDSPLMQYVNNGNFAAISDKLAGLWNAALDRRHANTFAVTATMTPANFGGGASGYGIEQAINPVVTTKQNQRRGPIGDLVNDVVGCILTSIQAYLKANNVSPIRTDTWSGPTAPQLDPSLDPKDPNSLESAFQKFFNQATGECSEADLASAPRLDPCAEAIDPPRPHTTATWLQWVTDHNPGLAKKWATPRQANDPIFSGEVRNPDRMKPDTWGFILYADGWATDGPSDNNAGHPAV